MHLTLSISGYPSIPTNPYTTAHTTATTSATAPTFTNTCPTLTCTFILCSLPTLVSLLWFTKPALALSLVSLPHPHPHSLPQGLFLPSYSAENRRARYTSGNPLYFTFLFPSRSSATSFVTFRLSDPIPPYSPRRSQPRTCRVMSDMLSFRVLCPSAPSPPSWATTPNPPPDGPLVPSLKAHTVAPSCSHLISSLLSSHLVPL